MHIKIPMKLGFKKLLLKTSQSFSATNGMFLWRHITSVSQTSAKAGTFTERPPVLGKMRAFSAAMGTCFKSQREIQRCTMLFVRDVAKKLN